MEVFSNIVKRHIPYNILMRQCWVCCVLCCRKDLLQDAVNLTNCCRKEYLTSSQAVQASVDEVKKDKEYASFITKHKYVKHSKLYFFNTYKHLLLLLITAYDKMWTLKFKALPTNAFFATVSIKFLAAPPGVWLLLSTVSLSELYSAICLLHARQ